MKVRRSWGKSPFLKKRGASLGGGIGAKGGKTFPAKKGKMRAAKKKRIPRPRGGEKQKSGGEGVLSQRKNRPR